MSASYIPAETYAVCTYQMGSDPQKFIASRDKTSVFHKDKALLTCADKNLEKPFTCKAPVSIAAAFLAFGVGLLFVASGPVGWAIAGAALVVGVIYTIKAIKHKCTSPMKSGQWALVHLKVRFNDYNALTQISMLSCDNGGIVRPFFSYSIACEAAKRISNNNLVEVGVNTAIAFFAGYLAPGMAENFAKNGLLYIIKTNVAGLGITWTLQYGERELLRSDEDLADNQVYQNMNTEVDTNSWLQPVKTPADPNDFDNVFAFQEAIQKGKIVTQNLQTNQTIERFSTMTTDQLKGSAEYAQFLANVQKGIYGAELKQKMSNIFGRLKPNSSSVVKGMNYSYENFNSSFKSMARKTGIGALFFLPFIGAFFSENTRKFFAEEAVKDMTNGINVVSENPLGRDS